MASSKLVFEVALISDTFATSMSSSSVMHLLSDRPSYACGHQGCCSELNSAEKRGRITPLVGRRADAIAALTAADALGEVHRGDGARHFCGRLRVPNSNSDTASARPSAV